MSVQNTTSDSNSFRGIGRTIVRWLGKLSTIGRDPAKEKFLSEMASSRPPRPEEFEALLTLLHKGAVEIQCRSSFGSNSVYYVLVSYGQQQIGGVYKPVRGEAPLGDFPKGTLAAREAAAFLVSEALGWHLVPPTVYRTEAPLGPGAIQVYINTPPSSYHLRFTAKDIPALKRVALFDLLTNNADRKQSHLLPGNCGGLWSIDHGLCFHKRFKRRTFIWDFDDKPIPENLLNDVAGFRQRLDSDQQMIAALNALLSPSEMAALRRRADALLAARRYVALYSFPNGWFSIH
jgi:uncharacterized repeat protein (TIGR03843 family)